MSVASLLRPTVPVIDVAPFNVVTPVTVSVMAAEIAPLKVMVSVPTDPASRRRSKRANLLSQHSQLRSCRS